MIGELLEAFDSPNSRPLLNLKDLEHKVGFLVHLAMAYPLMFPFLRGFCLTMNSWRKGRDKDGWKMSKSAFSAFLDATRRAGHWFQSDTTSSSESTPVEVKAVPDLYCHVAALAELFESEEPTLLRLIRGSLIYQVVYVFGDASGEGVA